MERIDPITVIQQRLASGMGLDKYADIENMFQLIDVSQDADFQRTFNGFYMVRRNAEWRAVYYGLFEKMKNSELATFDYILDEMYRLTGNVEASFSSKMLATIKPEMPIWDRYVIQNLSIKVPGQADPERLQKTKAIYRGIIDWYKEFLQTDNAQECLRKFDEVLPNYTWLSPVKKIDFYLWSIR